MRKGLPLSVVVVISKTGKEFVVAEQYDVRAAPSCIHIPSIRSFDDDDESISKNDFTSCIIGIKSSSSSLLFDHHVAKAEEKEDDD
jgi:hypothetical protein